MLDAIVQGVISWKGKCAVCFIQGREYRHIITNCAHPDGQAAAEEHGRMMSQEGIKFVRKIVCWRCGLPQQACDRWRGIGQVEMEGGSQKKCRFMRVISGIVCGIRQASPETWQAWWQGGRWVGGEIVDEERRIKALGHTAEGEIAGGVMLMYAFWEMSRQITEKVGEGRGS